MGTRGRILIAVGATALLTSLLVGVASGHKKGYKVDFASYFYANQDSRIGVDPVDYFEGQLVNRHRGKPNCAAKRQVRVVRFAGGSTTLIGFTTTDGKGRWKLPAEDVPAGDYRAIAKSRLAKTGQRHVGKHICRKAGTDPISFGPGTPGR